MNIAKNPSPKTALTRVITISLIAIVFGLLARPLASAYQLAGHADAEQKIVPAGTTEGEEHGLPQIAVEIARPLGFPITNSMVVCWIVAVGLILFARAATRT